MNFHEGLSLAAVQGISAITVAPVRLPRYKILARFCCMFKAFHMYVPIVVARPSAAITRILNYHCTRPHSYLVYLCGGLLSL